MKNLVMSSLVALAVTSATGCIIVDDSEDRASIGFAWSVKANNAAVACPAGFDTARSVVVPHGDTTGATKVVDLFNCAAGAGRTAPLAPGQYDTWVEITSHDGAVIYAQSTPVYVDLTNTDKDVSFDIHTDKGYYFTNWSLKGKNSGAALTCGQVPSLAKIALDATGGANPSTEFDCLQEAGYTTAFAVGLYQVAVAAVNAQGQALGQSATFANKQIEAPNKVTNLGTSLLLIDGQ